MGCFHKANNAAIISYVQKITAIKEMLEILWLLLYRIYLLCI